MAKTYSDLYGRLTKFQNLWLAYLKAARGKRGTHPIAWRHGVGAFTR